jgi:dihydrofolate reductase
MKVTLIAAVTADWFIAKSPDHKADWTSKADKEHFRETTKKIGVVIMGSKTFETIGRGLPNRRNIVMSRTKKYEGVETTGETPEDLIQRLEKEGVKEVAVAGGAQIYTAFMKAGLIDRILLTIEPVVFGEGVPLLSHPATKPFELKSTTSLSGGGVVLDYEINR